MCKRALSVGLISALAFAPFAGEAKANDATFREIQFHAFSQPVIYCVAAMECEVVLQAGEHVKDSVNSQATLWDGQMLYEGVDPQIPHLVVKPPMAGLAANLIVTTDKRTYRILFRSVASSFPTYTRFHYDDEARLAARLHARDVARVPATPAPLTIAAAMDAACATMPTTDWYGTDAQPIEMRPARTCHDASHTYVQMPTSATVPSDLPVVMEAAADGDRTINSSYDDASRTYRIDGVADEYVLLAAKHRMHVQLQHPKAKR
jgi:type IV secretory pathway VirB9-like protein